MSAKPPHFVLFSEFRPVQSTSSAAVEVHAAGVWEREITDTSQADGEHGDTEGGVWHFVLRSPDGRTQLEVTESEPAGSRERLDLLAVVRGLEALDQPSRVTLVTPSVYVRRGLRFGLATWRENGWQWERFGSMAPIKNRDLWRRVDRALRYHHVECKLWRRDAAHDDLCEARVEAAAPSSPPPSSAVPAPKAFGRKRPAAVSETRSWPRRFASWLLGSGSRASRPDLIVAPQ